MFLILKRYLRLCGEDSCQIKKSILFGFFEGIFESFSFMAVFYLFWKLENKNWQLVGLTIKDVLIITIILVVGILFRWLMKYKVYILQGTAGYSTIARARLSIGDRLKSAPMGFFYSKSIGDTITTLTDDMHYIEKNAAFVMEKSINNCIEAFVLSVGMVLFDYRVGILFLIGEVLSLLVIASMQKEGTKKAGAIKQIQSDVNQGLIEYLRGIETSKLYRKSDTEDMNVKNRFRKFGQKSYQMEKSLICKNLLFFLLSRTACAMIASFITFLAMNGQNLSVGKAIVLFTAVFVVYQPLEALGSVISMVRMLEVSMNRIEQMKKLQIMGGGSKEINKYDIYVENVSFGYDKEENVLKNITLTIPQNSVTAVVGPSGCGKTTLTRILARFWDSSDGKIFIGGTDIAEISMEKLYSYYSIVFQEVFLFHDTIENNIKFGKPGATHEEVIEAAQKACCHEFIENFEKGYDTIVGENGNNLSGGEKQRISIARALLKGAPIVLLDEATASVDPENEWMVNQALYELVKGKTVVVIAHKMSTIMRANQIVVLENGKVHNIGTHEELMVKDDIYKNFWKSRKSAMEWQIN